MHYTKTIKTNTFDVSSRHTAVIMYVAWKISKQHI